MPLPPGTHEGWAVYRLLFSLYPFNSYLFPPCCPDDILGDLFFPSLFCVCAARLSRFSCAFLSYEYLLQGCVLFSNFVPTRFFISVCMGQTHSLPRSLATCPCHTLFVSLPVYPSSL